MGFGRQKSAPNSIHRLSAIKAQLSPCYVFDQVVKHPCYSHIGIGPLVGSFWCRLTWYLVQKWCLNGLNCNNGRCNNGTSNVAASKGPRLRSALLWVTSHVVRLQIGPPDVLIS